MTLFSAPTRALASPFGARRCGVRHPDRLWGEAVTAVVVGTPSTDLSVEEVQAFCREHLADYMRPKHIHVADGLPRNSYGKVLKRELRAIYPI